MNSKVFKLNNLPTADFQEITNILKFGKIGVIPTDTIYGIVGSALNEQTVEQIYTLRKRTPTKPMIILISSLEDLEKFDITIGEQTKRLLQNIWPNPVSVILPCNDPKFEYLHRGTQALAFRMPDHEFLQNLLQKTGPLVVPSANFEGEPPALTIQEAQKYFGDDVDLYIDAGKLESDPSTVIKIENSTVLLIREGKYSTSSLLTERA